MTIEEIEEGMLPDLGEVLVKFKEVVHFLFVDVSGNFVEEEGFSLGHG